MLRKILSETHYFTPAVDHRINYVGRWMPTPNRLRWDTAFPGSYIDIIVRNASTIYFSLSNTPSREVAAIDDETKVRRMMFKPIDDEDKAAAPVALTVLLCNGNMLQFPTSDGGLLAVDISARSDETDCPVRISYAGGTSERAGTLQFKGLWIPHGSSLQLRTRMDRDEEASLDVVSDSAATQRGPDRKTIEFLTDFPEDGDNTTYMLEWQAQLAAQFNADHVKIATHDHCLTKTCMKMQDSQFSTQDVFFRSGPASSDFFAKPWNFHHYVPDVLILNLGTVDQRYFHGISRREGRIELVDSYQSVESFTNSIISTYIALIQQIRRTAYPLHPSALDRYTFDGDGYTYNSAPSTLPIFVMRPFDGSLEQATLAVVEQMQKEGDKSVFWIDTSGWLSDMDYTIDDQGSSARSLTSAGHAEVASFMHTHLCHYLAPDPEQCPFLRRDNYLGNVYVPVEAELDKVIEENKVKKLTELFWEYS